MTGLLLAGFLGLVGCTDKSPPSDSVPRDTGTWYAPGCGDCDGYTVDEGDCNNADPEINPSAKEVCDGHDNDCDGETDEEGQSWYFEDRDGDGFGDSAAAEFVCDPWAGLVAFAGDCDDTDDEINPAATEVCDGVDNDCDSAIDEDLATTWYADSDGDGYGEADSTLLECDATTGFVATAGDCDDTRADVNPGATEACDGVDNDCDELVDEDC